MKEIQILVLSAANCIDRFLPFEQSQICSLLQVRSDVFVRFLQGENLNSKINCSKLRSWYKKPIKSPGRWVPDFFYTGFLPLPDQVDPNQVKFILWSNLTDEVLWFYDFNGIPYAPTVLPQVGVKEEDLREFLHLFPQLRPLSVDERTRNYIEANLVASLRFKKATKILVQYDTSRIALNRKESFEKSASAMAEVLSPLGWKIIKISENFPSDPTDDYWAHYDSESIREFMRKEFERFL